VLRANPQDAENAQHGTVKSGQVQGNLLHLLWEQWKKFLELEGMKLESSHPFA